MTRAGERLIRSAKQAVEMVSDPKLLALLERTKNHVMTSVEIEAQRQSWIRAMKPTGDPRFD